MTAMIRETWAEAFRYANILSIIFLCRYRVTRVESGWRIQRIHSDEARWRPANLS